MVLFFIYIYLLYKTQFQSNINKIQQKIQSWFAAAKTLKAELEEDDQVFVQWISLVKDFDHKMQVLKELAYATLKVFFIFDYIIMFLFKITKKKY